MKHFELFLFSSNKNCRISFGDDLRIYKKRVIMGGNSDAPFEKVIIRRKLPAQLVNWDAEKQGCTVLT